MRKTLLTIAAAAAIGVAAVAGVSAAPSHVAPLGQASSAVDNVTKVWHCRYWNGGSGCGGYWRWSGWGCRRCNPWRCWWVC